MKGQAFQIEGLSVLRCHVKRKEDLRAVILARGDSASSGRIREDLREQFFMMLKPRPVTEKKLT